MSMQFKSNTHRWHIHTYVRLPEKETETEKNSAHTYVR